VSEIEKRLLWTSAPDVALWHQAHPDAGGPHFHKNVYTDNIEMLVELSRRCAQYAVPNGILALGAVTEDGKGVRAVVRELRKVDSCLRPFHTAFAEYSIFMTGAGDLYTEEENRGRIDRCLFRAFRFGVSPQQKSVLMAEINEGEICLNKIKAITYGIGKIFEEIFLEI